MGMERFKGFGAAIAGAFQSAPEQQELSELDKIPHTLEELERITNDALREDDVQVAYRLYSSEKDEKLFLQIDGDFTRNGTEYDGNEYPKTIAARIIPSDDREGGFFVSMTTSDNPVNRLQEIDSKGKPIDDYGQALDVILNEHHSMLPDGLQQKIRKPEVSEASHEVDGARL